MGTTVRDDFVEQSKAEEDFVEEKGHDSFGGDGLLRRAKNHPLSKPMVDHNQKGIYARRKGKIHDKIAVDLLKGVGCQGFDG